MKTLIAFLTVLTLAGIQNASACVGCRATGSFVEEATVKAGFGLSCSVIFMLIVVATILSGLTWFITRTCQQVDSRNQSRGSKE